MDQKAIVRQMMEFNKAAFDNSFTAMVMVQDQAEKVANSLLDQTNNVPCEGKKAVEQWITACKQGRDGFKNSMDESYKRLSAFFDQFPKSE